VVVPRVVPFTTMLTPGRRSPFAPSVTVPFIVVWATAHSGTLAKIVATIRGVEFFIQSE
jgi:hypothetical protein